MTNDKLSQRVWKISEHEKEAHPTKCEGRCVTVSSSGQRGLFSNPTNLLSTSGVNSVLHFEGFGYSKLCSCPLYTLEMGFLGNLCRAVKLGKANKTDKTCLSRTGQSSEVLAAWGTGGNTAAGSSLQVLAKWHTSTARPASGRKHWGHLVKSNWFYLFGSVSRANTQKTNHHLKNHNSNKHSPAL